MSALIKQACVSGLLLVWLVVVGCPPMKAPEFPEKCTKSRDCPGSLVCHEQKCVGSVEGGAPDEPPKDPPVGDGQCKAWEERPCYEGPKETEGVGSCKPGKQICQQSGEWGPCEGQVLPQAEDCNDKDDDCDGSVDEDLERPCYEGPPGTEKKGECKEGKQRCQDGQWEKCEGQKLPADEDCTNGKDDDCNGTVDDAEPCKPAPCRNNQDCRGQFCVIGLGKEEGSCLQLCEKDEDCPSILRCVPLAVGSAKYCVPVIEGEGSCNPEGFRFCPTGRYCRGGKCVPSRKASLYQPCDGLEQLCEKGKVCAYLPLTGRCLFTCEGGKCPSGEVCIPQPGKGAPVCLRACRTNDDCKGLKDWICQDVPPTAPAPPTNRLCLPKGGQGPWDPCRRGEENCAPGLRCLMAEPVRGIGYCIPVACKVNSDCPPIPNVPNTLKASCVAYDGSACLLACKNNHKVCDAIQGYFCRKTPKNQWFCSP